MVTDQSPTEESRWLVEQAAVLTVPCPLGPSLIRTLPPLPFYMPFHPSQHTLWPFCLFAGAIKTFLYPIAEESPDTVCAEEL